MRAVCVWYIPAVKAKQACSDGQQRARTVDAPENATWVTRSKISGWRNEFRALIDFLRACFCNKEQHELVHVVQPSSHDPLRHSRSSFALHPIFDKQTDTDLSPPTESRLLLQANHTQSGKVHPPHNMSNEILFNSPALHALKRHQLVSLSKRYGLKASGKVSHRAQWM
jgi:hypothetical protein